MGELAEEQAQTDGFPDWALEYLAAWGSKVGPDGKRMRVKTAAALAGTTDSNVRELRRTNERFRLMEGIARNAGAMYMASYAEAGLRALAPEILRAFADLVRSRNAQIVVQAMKILLGPETVQLTGSEGKDLLPVPELLAALKKADELLSDE